VHAVADEVAAGAVAVRGGAGVGVAGQDLRVEQGDAGVHGVGDRGVPQRVGADAPGDLGGLGDALHHPVHVAPVDRASGDRPQRQRPG